MLTDGSTSARAARASPILQISETGSNRAMALTTAADLSVAFVSQAAVDAGDDHMTTRRRRVAVRDNRNIGPADLVLNTRLGRVDVDPATGMVSLDGDTVYSDPSESVSLSRLYFL